MSMGTLMMVAESVNGTLVGADQRFDSVSTDTRTLQPGQLFFALHGERFDAAEFVNEAARLGAAGAVVEHRQSCALSQVEVQDTREALGELAKKWRARFSISVIALTGSNGKTTVKEMIAEILRAHVSDEDTLLVTAGNLNNEIGLPLTVLQLRDRHRIAVLEMGASHRGEVAHLAEIAAPGIGIVTNAGIAHLEGFGSKENVAAGKGELFESLPEDGVAIINRDDEFFAYWQDLCAHVDVRTFGLSDSADFRATDIREVVDDAHCNLSFLLHSPFGNVEVQLPMAGRHNIRNALAATAAATAAGATWEAVQQGLAAMGNVSGRMRAVTTVGGMTIFDDSYNANPGSVQAAIDFLSERDGPGWLALGDMAELGPNSAELHRAVGRKARQAGIERLFCLGEQARESAEAFGEGASSYTSIDDMAEAIKSERQPGIVLLVKGSRCMGLERLVSTLQQEGAA
jgi:UDP-N-acetylmuramoyl-tripeptide--D-alanyl-D-alanine ligase